MNRSAPIPETVTLHVPFRVVKRGGRKEAAARGHQATAADRQHAGEGAGSRVPVEAAA